MKKIFSLLTAATLLLSFFVACKSGGSGDTYNIKLKLAKGDTFTQTNTMVMDMTTSAMGQNMEMKMNMETASNFEVLNDDSLSRELKMTYGKLEASMDMGKMGGSSKMSDSILNETYSKIVGKSVIMKISPNNEIIDVKGMENLMSRENLDPETAQMLEKMFSKEQMNTLFGMLFSMYPKNPVKIGDKWTSSSKANVAGMDMKINLTYTLVGVKNGLADIDVDGVIDANGKMNQGGMSMDVKMSGTQKGTLTILMDNGHLQDGHYKMDVKAEMEMMGQKIPMTMKANYTLKGT